MTCTHSHHEGMHACPEDDEDDPCLAHHNAVMEKGRVLKERLRAQEDIIIGARERISRSIRLAGDPEEVNDENVVFTVNAEEVQGFMATGGKTFLLVFPCDLPSQVDVDVVEGAFEEIASKTKMGQVRFLKLSTRLCVCGKCEKKQSVGLLRNFAILLRGTPAVFASAGRGICGFLPLSGDFETKLDAFIQKI